MKLVSVDGTTLINPECVAALEECWHDSKRWTQITLNDGTKLQVSASKDEVRATLEEAAREIEFRLWERLVRGE